LALVFFEQGRQINIVIFHARFQILTGPEQHFPVATDQKVQKAHQSGGSRWTVRLDTQDTIPQRIDPVKRIQRIILPVHIIVFVCTATRVPHDDETIVLVFGVRYQLQL
jgi:hypothetical protein